MAKCGKGCGSPNNLIELMVKDILRQQIDANLIQEALKDCDGKYLKKDMQVVTCAGLKDKLCQLIEDGEVCVPSIDALTFDPTSNTLSLTKSDGEALTTTLPIKDDTFLQDVSYDKKTFNLVFTMSDGVTKHNVNVKTTLKSLLDVTDSNDTVAITLGGDKLLDLPKVEVIRNPQEGLQLKVGSNTPVNLRPAVNPDQLTYKGGVLNVVEKPVEVVSLTDAFDQPITKLVNAQEA